MLACAGVLIPASAQATCFSTCYDIDLISDECKESGKSVFEYQVRVGGSGIPDCYGLDKFKLKVLDCSQVDSVQFPSGMSGSYSCSNGEILINPSGSQSDNTTKTYKVTMKTCLFCPDGGDWRAIGSNNDCQFTGYTDVPKACECRDGDDCDDHDPCTEDFCDDDECGHTPKTGNICDDGNPCTNEDSCNNGDCQGTPIEGCVQCEVDETCDDGLVCNGEEFCGEDDICHDGTPLVCEDDGNSCTDDLCSEEAGGCDHPPDDENTCDDQDPCTNEDSCHDGLCEGTRVDGCQSCESSENCDDGLVCNGLETCGENNTCQLGDPIVCEDDGNPCTDDLCSEEAQGCEHPNNEDACDDNDPCTTADSCSLGECVPGPVDPECTPPSCGDGTCDGGETCATCGQDCGLCPLGDPDPCGNGICEPGEDCLCSDCDSTEVCTLRAQQLKCAQDLVAESNGRLSAQAAENLAAELMGEGVPCTLIAQAGSGGVKGCSLNRNRFLPSPWGAAGWLGTVLPLLYWMRRKESRAPVK